MKRLLIAGIAGLSIIGALRMLWLYAPGLLDYNLTVALPTCVVSILLLSSGVGMLLLRNWARRVWVFIMSLWSVYAVLVAVTVVLGVVRIMQSMTSRPATLIGSQVAQTGLISLLGVWLLTRKDIKALFR